MTYRCPGSERMRTPDLKTKICPVCGGDIDIFSIDVTAKCEKCGFTAYNDEKTCVLWCKYAKECVGEELYNALTKKKEPVETQSIT